MAKYQAVTYTLNRTKAEIAKMQKSHSITPKKLYHGLALMHNAFDCYDVLFIIDATTGKKVPKNALYDYNLIAGPLSYIAIDGDAYAQ